VLIPDSGPLREGTGLLDNLPDAVVIHDMDFRIRYVNRAAEELYGFRAEELLGCVFAEILPIDFLQQKSEDVWRQILHQGCWRGETVQKGKDGRGIRVRSSVSPIRDDEGNPVAIIGVVRAVPETEAAPGFDERDRILNLSQDLICVAGTDGYYKYLNPAWERVTGYTRQELQSKPFIEFVHPDDRAKTVAEAEKLRTGELTVDFENRYQRGDGSLLHLSWVATPLAGAGLIYAIARDITQRKQAEQQVGEYQGKLRALALELTLAEENERRRIAADLHDRIGHSLALARIQLEKIQASGLDPEQNALAGDISSILLESLQGTRSLIFELSSLSMNEFGLAGAVADWLEGHVEKRHGLKTELVDRCNRRPADQGLCVILYRNVRELLANVIRHAAAKSVRVLLEDGGDAFRIVITDDGKGCGPEDLARMGAREGGFGLFSIRERLADYGGELKITSEPGKGCEITMTVPAGQDGTGGAE
jgi:PAS domain S-box-containing protein